MGKKTQKPDPMSAQDAAKMIANARDAGGFDLSRLTAVGWLLSLFSIALPVVVCILVLKDQKPNEIPVNVVAFAALAGVAVTFVLGRWGLSHLGIVVVRPEAGEVPTPSKTKRRQTKDSDDDEV